MSGATDEAIEGVTVVARPALVAAAIDVLKADGYLLGTPANIGYMSGCAQALFRPGVLPVPGCDRATTVWSVCPRQQRHHRGGPGGRGDCSGSAVAARADAGGRPWHPEPGGPPGLLGTWRRARGRLDPAHGLTCGSSGQGRAAHPWLLGHTRRRSRTGCSGPSYSCAGTASDRSSRCEPQPECMKAGAE
jgi:hypothetical protein